MTTRAPFHSRPPNQPSSVSSGDVPGSQAADADRANSSDSTQTQAEYLESFKSGWRAFQSEVLDWRSRCSQAAGRMYTIAKPNHDLRQQLWAITKATKSICASLLNQGYDGFSSGSTTSNFVKTAFSLEGTKDKVGEMEAAKSILLSNDGPLEFDYPFRQERLEKELDSLTQEVNSLAERVAPWALDARGLSIGKQVDRTRSSSDVSRACLQYAEGMYRPASEAQMAVIDTLRREPKVWGYREGIVR